MEKYVNNTLIGVIYKYRIVTDSQYGLRENTGMPDILEHFTDNIFENLDRGRHIMASFIDFITAFETRNYDILLGRLHCLCIRGTARD